MLRAVLFRYENSREHVCRGSVQMPTTGATKRETSSEHPDSTLLSLEDLAQIHHSPISVLDRGQGYSLEGTPGAS